MPATGISARNGLGHATYDAIVVGAGYIGCAVAYHLAAAGLKTALLDRGGLAAGASRANYGNIQVQDAELAHSLPMVKAGYARFADLEERLDCSVGLRRIGGLLLIETEAQWRLMADRLPALHAAGIDAELIPAQRLSELEPLLDPSTVLGACYHPHEGQVNPFRLLWAYVRRGLEAGLELGWEAEVLGIDVAGGRVQGVRTNQGAYGAAVVVLCTGAWTPLLGRTLGRDWAIRHVHGQAIVTEPMAERLHNHVASAAFFEAMHGDGEVSQDAAVLAMSQTAAGNFLLGEAGGPTASLRTDARPGGQAAIAALVGRHFPTLRHARILRGWAAPVAFTDDGMPYLGPVDGVDGLVLATAFKSTVIVTPLVGEAVAQWALTGRTDLDWSAKYTWPSAKYTWPFAPGSMAATSREIGHGG